jgi:hypothetical protein
MSVDLKYDYSVSLAVSEKLNSRWRELCGQYLPLIREHEIWRYSRKGTAGDPRQGWKLHLSATVLTATDVLEKVAPLLQSRAILFKAPASLQELSKLNCGLFYGYCQIGKFITVYPRTTVEAVELAQLLHELTCLMPAPGVPFDRRFRPDSCVYYRYGSFETLELTTPDGLHLPAMRDLDGNLVPDLRYSETPGPEWASDPFINQQTSQAVEPLESPLKTTFRAFRALAQRGKGGVYKAFDFSVLPPRFCLLKEGRKSGEVCWDGRDGFWRVQHEERVLTLLRAAGVGVPQVYSSFAVGDNFYLVTEFVAGENLQSFLFRRRRRLSIAQGLRYALQLSILIARMHVAGWAWRDCKPTNIMLTKRGVLRPLDFEGACSVQQPDPMPWGTPNFIPPEWQKAESKRSGVADDMFALGAVIYLLLTGRLPEPQALSDVAILRPRVPQQVRDLISELLSDDPERRPHAQAAMQRLRAACALADNSSPTRKTVFSTDLDSGIEEAGTVQQSVENAAR